MLHTIDVLCHIELASKANYIIEEKLNKKIYNHFTMYHVQYKHKLFVK